MGQQPIGRGTLHLDDVFVPAENLVGSQGHGFAMVMSHFDYSRTAIGLQCRGAARREPAWRRLRLRQAAACLR
jgi:cyclohexanecarboxyl-CoA dehydrogenase